MVDMPDFDEVKLAQLARELAMNIKNAHTIFAEFGIDEEQYYELMAHNEFFKKLKEQYTRDWQSTLSTADRLKIGSLAYLEQLLPRITKRALRLDEPLASATGVGKLLAQAAGLGERDQGPAQSERFVITINLGGETETYNKSIEVNPNDVSEIKHGEIDSEGTKEPAIKLICPTGEGGGSER